MEHYIYKITNLINGKYYYGKRSCKGLAINDSYMGSGIGISKAIIKYGSSNFKKEILYYCSSEAQAYEKESEILTPETIKDPLCYNQKCGGLGGMNGFKYSDEYKVRCSKRFSGSNHPSFGKPRSEDTKEKLRQANLGKKNNACTESRKIKIGKSNGKAVKQYTIDGEFVAEYYSATEASRQNGWNIGCQTKISLCCNGNKPQYKGFIFKYVD